MPTKRQAAEAVMRSTLVRLKAEMPHSTVTWLLDDLRAAGYTIVPREPTAEMLERMWGGEETAGYRYSGLIAAAEDTGQ